MMTNTLALGAAYQRGLLPVSGEALERAIELNGAAVEKNLAALRWGRAVVGGARRRRGRPRARRRPWRPCASCPTSSSTSSGSP
jgi:indolepyruvate ferredoxin oxidoreductase